MTEVYSAVISPPFDIAEPIKIFKQGLESVIGKYASFYSDPSIILFAAMGDENKISQIEKRMEIICRNQIPFTIHLKDFDEFYNNGTIFISTDDQSKSHLTSLRKKLSAEIKTAKFDEDVDFNVGKIPHITIARTLSEDQYQVAKKYFANRKYEAQFECNSITWRKLVKTDAYSNYETVRSFSFAQKNLSLF